MYVRVSLGNQNCGCRPAACGWQLYGCLPSLGSRRLAWLQWQLLPLPAHGYGAVCVPGVIVAAGTLYRSRAQLCGQCAASAVQLAIKASLVYSLLTPLTIKTQCAAALFSVCVCVESVCGRQSVHEAPRTPSRV